MAHELLSLRIPPEMKAWLEAEVRRRQDWGERKCNMTVIVMELLDGAMKVPRFDPVPGFTDVLPPRFRVVEG